MARPLKEINWDLVVKKMEAGCSASEIYNSPDISLSQDTFYDRFKAKFECGFSDYSSKYHEGGKGNIRFTQYIKALKGDTKMLTLLGEEWLGQGKIKEETPKNQHDIDKDHRIMELENQLAIERAKNGMD